MERVEKFDIARGGRGANVEEAMATGSGWFSVVFIMDGRDRKEKSREEDMFVYNAEVKSVQRNYIDVVYSSDTDENE